MTFNANNASPACTCHMAYAGTAQPQCPAHGRNFVAPPTETKPLSEKEWKKHLIVSECARNDRLAKLSGKEPVSEANPEFDRGFRAGIEAAMTLTGNK